MQISLRGISNYTKEVFRHTSEMPKLSRFVASYDLFFVGLLKMNIEIFTIHIIKSSLFVHDLNTLAIYLSDN